MDIKLGENLSELIKKTGKTSKDIAEEIGIPVVTLHEYATKHPDRKRINPSHLFKICRYFNVTSDQLLYSMESKALSTTQKLREFIKTLEI